MADVHRPFSIKRSIVAIDGGSLDEPWLVEVKKQKIGLFDHEFVSISMTDRKFARSMGLDCTARSPFQNTTLLHHIAKLRNEKVDQAIQKFLLRNDPMADDDASSQLSCIPQDRAKSFATAQVPQVIEIRIGAFTKEAGERIPEKKLKVYSTPRRDALLTIELSEATLDWLSEAIWHEWDVTNAPWLRTFATSDDLPELQYPDICFYRLRGGKWCIVAMIRGPSGNVKPHQKTLGNIDHMTEEMLKFHVMSIEQQVAAMYHRLNHPEPNEEVQS